jgi:hypothetical protein
MNLTEDHLREALRVTADEIGADRVRPLTLPADGRPCRARATGRLGGSRWLPAVAAAAAVIAIAATSVAIGTGAGQRGAESSRTSLPPYYVAVSLPGTNDQTVTTVGNTRTGAVLARVHPPTGWSVIEATAGPDNDSFLLETIYRQQIGRIYLLKFSPADRGTRMIRLPIPAVRPATSLAISPSGTEVALSAGSQLRIYTLSGRLIRHWRSPGRICPAAGLAEPCLSWATSGYLAFSWYQPNDAGASGIRLIRATAASGGLIRESRVVLPSKAFKGPVDPSILLSRDGTTLAVNAEVRRSGKMVWRFEEFSVATGKLTWLFRPGAMASSVPWWTNRTGSTLIVSGILARTRASRPPFGYGTLTHRGFTALAPAPTRRWSTFAF